MENGPGGHTREDPSASMSWRTRATASSPVTENRRVRTDSSYSSGTNPRRRCAGRVHLIAAVPAARQRRSRCRHAARVETGRRPSAFRSSPNPATKAVISGRSAHSSGPVPRNVCGRWPRCRTVKHGPVGWSPPIPWPSPAVSTHRLRVRRSRARRTSRAVPALGRRILRHPQINE